MLRSVGFGLEHMVLSRQQDVVRVIRWDGDLPFKLNHLEESENYL